MFTLLYDTLFPRLRLLIQFVVDHLRISARKLLIPLCGAVDHSPQHSHRQKIVQALLQARNEQNTASYVAFFRDV